MTLKAPSATTLAVVLATTLVFGAGKTAGAQPAKGAPAAFARVRDVMAERFKGEKLTGDPDQDFAALLAATYEELVFLSKTQLEYGGDRHLRDIAQKIQNDQQKQIDNIKDWQVRSQQAGYKAQPDQPPSGSGPLDTNQGQSVAAAPAAAALAKQAASSDTPGTASNAPLVSGTVKKVDPGSAKVTLDHERIPNIDMDAMTMAYKVQTPALLNGLKPGDKVRFSAEEVNGQTFITRIQPR